MTIPKSNENSSPGELQKNALQLHNAGHFIEAEQLFMEILASYTNSAEIYKNYGNTLLCLERLDEAENAYRTAIDLKNDYAAAYNNLGNALLIKNELEEAEQAFLQALKHSPGNAEIFNNYGNLLSTIGKKHEAEQAYLKSTLLDQNYSTAHYNRANILMHLGDIKNAEEEYRKVIELAPNHYKAYCNLGDLLIRLDKQEESEVVLRKVLEFKPDLVEAHNNLGNVLCNIGRPDEAIYFYQRALEINPDSTNVYNNLLLCMNYAQSYSNAKKFETALQYGHMVSQKSNERFASWHCANEPTRLRVGLVSGDLRNHPVGFFLENVLAHIDISRIELFAYPTNYEFDKLTARIKSNFSSWKPVANLNDKDAASLIHSDAIHVLIDLSGHTMHNRLAVFACKPAPVQISWLGYLATTGMSEIDYIIGDNLSTPPENDWQFSETVWRMPDIWACFSPPVEVCNTSRLPALSAGYITFGCFNNLTKINDSVINLWSRVILAVPGSRLFLKTKQLANQKIAESIRNRFSEYGVDPNRLILEGASPRSELLLTYNKIDIALDPYPYGGGTTTFELLWMAVPIITRKGDSFLSRCGQSIVYNAGLEDWIADDDDDYVSKAVEHSSDLNKLAVLRSNLRNQVLKSPLFDAQRFARHFENSLFQIWELQKGSTL